MKGGGEGCFLPSECRMCKGLPIVLVQKLDEPRAVGPAHVELVPFYECGATSNAGLSAALEPRTITLVDATLLVHEYLPASLAGLPASSIRP